MIRERNLMAAYPALLNKVLKGKEYAPRGNKVQEATGPVVWNLSHPWEWGLLIPQRRLNPFFALAEVIWMWSGKGGAEFITYYNKSFAQFMDPGIPYFNAAYGKRIRHAGYKETPFRDIPYPRTLGQIPEPVEVDQLQFVLRKLQADPETRQAVVSLWDPIKDNFTQSKDHPCLSGETVLFSPEGKMTLKELSESFASGLLTRYPVLSFNTQTKKQELSWCTNVWKTGRKRLFKITFDDGTHVRATADHRFFKKKYRDAVFCQEIRVDQLQPGDRVWASQVTAINRKHLHFQKVLNGDTGWANWTELHRQYAELADGPIPAGVDVHHIDENKMNNRYNNLERLTHTRHTMLHHNQDRLGEANPMRMLPKTARVVKGAVHSLKLKENWAKQTPEQREARRQKQREGWAKRKETQNHVVVAIEPVGVEDVYDFQVPGNHNARLDNGVFTHNCNNMVYFSQREGKLNITVVIRSNDLIWGTPYNMIQFVHLHALMAGTLGYEMGMFSVMCNNLHIYENLYPETRKLILDWHKQPSNRHVYNTKLFADIPDMRWNLDSFDRFISQVWDPLDNQLRSAQERFAQYADKTGGGTTHGAQIMMSWHRLEDAFTAHFVPEYWQQLFTVVFLHHVRKAKQQHIFIQLSERLHTMFWWLITDFTGEFGGAERAAG